MTFKARVRFKAWIRINVSASDAYVDRINQRKSRMANRVMGGLVMSVGEMLMAETAGLWGQLYHSAERVE